MIEILEAITRSIVIGTGATLAMDVWLLLLKRLNIPTLNFRFLGRWVGHVLRGRWAHESIAKADPIEHEVLLGWVAHYAIGILFAALLVFAFGLEWARAPSFLPALLVGIATVIAPLFVMQPAMGAGVASSKTSTPVRNCIRSLINHAVFGVGLYLAAAATASLMTAAP